MNVNDPIAPHPLGGLNIDAVDSMAHRHPATDFELRHGIPPRNEGLIAANDTRDRAQEARIGGNVYRHERTITHARGYTVSETDEYMASETRHKMNDRKASRRAMLPEAAFDWPIYREATGRTEDRATAD